MPSLAQLFGEQRRRIMLDTMLVSAGYYANDAVLRVVVESRLDVVDRALIRADLSYLETHGLLSIDKLAADGKDVWKARLTDTGAAVARGRSHQGVADTELS